MRDLVAARRRPGQLIVAFAAETGDVLANGRAKLARKGCDLLVVNQVGNGLAFGTADNEATVLSADGAEVKLPRAPKDEIADAIWDLVAATARPAGNSRRASHERGACAGTIRRRSRAGPQPRCAAPSSSSSRRKGV